MKNNKIIPIAKPIIDKQTFRAVKKVLKTGNLAQGPEVVAFEQEFSKIVQDRESVAVNSGTSALHLALLSLGVGPGDEVIVPSFTFAATANSVALAGATPVFVDIDGKTFNIDAKLIEPKITRQTKAILVVHLYGLPADMQAINEIGKKYKLFVIEDAAQAHGALIGKQPVGTFGDAAAFSFYPTKNMTSGEGGMIVFKNSENARKARLLRNQGMEIRYQNEIVGFNLRMTDIHAAIGRAQLRRLSEWIDKRQENAEKYSKELKTIGTPYIPNSYTHVFHQYTLTIEKNRDLFSESLKNMGIQSSVYYPKPVHKLPVFAKDYELIETQKACDSVLSIPVHPSLTKKDLKKIIKCINISGQDLL